MTNKKLRELVAFKNKEIVGLREHNDFLSGLVDSLTEVPEIDENEEESEEEEEYEDEDVKKKRK